jgi:hypothetical protein
MIYGLKKRQDLPHTETGTEFAKNIDNPVFPVAKKRQ